MPGYSPKILLPLLILLSALSGCGGGSGTGIQVEVVPPQSVEYLGLGAFLLGHEIVPVIPQIIGGDPNEWTVSPAFPQGVLLDSQTGVISGIPEQVHSPTPHTIVAQNGTGAVVVTVMISVLPTTPCQLTYGDELPLLIVGESMDPLVPFYGCGPIQLWTIDPELPEGLQFSGLDGTISGTPVSLEPASTHMISGFNQFGSTTTTITLQIVEAAPCDLEYSVDLIQLSYGEELEPIQPTVACGTPGQYEIEPALPDGLQLNPVSGELSGAGLTAHPLTDYQIVASNLAGETTFNLQLEVFVEAPCDLLYPLSEIMIQVGEEIPAGMSPQVSCGPVSEYSVEPALPSGMILDSSSGLISGVPEVAVPLGTFTLRAENPSGHAEFQLQLEVVPTAPCDLQYDPSDLVLEQGVALTLLSPQIGCGQPSFFEITPELPAGLIFDGITGEISGTPEVLQSAVNYTVAASNVSGATATQISITVLPQPPCDLSYPQSLLQLTVGLPLSAILPDVGCGGADSFNALPPLPAGLYLDSTTGSISGIPQFVGGPTQHVILAGNLAGTVSFPISIEILEEAPCDLTYPVLEIDEIIGQEIGPLQPLVGCGQASIWTVTPPLPSGLNLDAVTGILSGSVNFFYPQTLHQIVAANSAGTSVTELPILIREPAPCELDYGDSLIQLLPGEPLGPLLPTVGCGSVTNFSVDPALPAGILLDPANGQLSGSSATNQPLQSYLITASNDTGSTTFSLQLEVEGLAPCDIAYPLMPIAVPAGVDLVAQIPQQGCGPVDLWSIDPVLPAGLDLDPVTGEISGLALEESDTTHLVTAENQFGSTQTEIRVVIRSIYHYRGSELVIPYSSADGVGSGTMTLYAEESSLNPTYPTELSGLSMAIQYDSGILQFVEAQQSGDIAGLNGGSGPDFWAINPIQGGVLVGMLVSFNFGDYLSLPMETAIVELEFATVPDTFVGDTEGLLGELVWGNPTAIPLDNLVVIDGATSSLPLMESLPFNAQPQ